MTKFIYPLLLMIALLAGVREEAKADACSDCQTQKRISCSTKCDNAPDRTTYDGCVQACVKPACQKKCQGTSYSTSNSLDSAQEKCQKCLNRILAEGCPDICDRASPHYEKCRKSCAKQKCANQCTLPDAGFSKSAPRPKYACDQCKVSADPYCRSTCGSGEPGSEACTFHCIAETCKQSCSEEFDGLED